MESDLPIITPKVRKIIISSPAVGIASEDVITAEIPNVTTEDTDMDDTIIEDSVSPTVVGDSTDLEMAHDLKLAAAAITDSIEIDDAPASGVTASRDDGIDEPTKVLSNATMLCSHGMAQPAEAKNMKRIGQVSTNTIFSA